jgi:hypothetical protein
MKQRKKYRRNNEERGSTKEEAYISDLCARDVLTVTSSKIWQYLWPMQLTDALRNGAYTNLHFITAAH